MITTLEEAMDEIRKGGLLQHKGSEDDFGWRHASDCRWCEAFDFLENELIRLDLAVSVWKQRCLDAEDEVEFEHAQFEKMEKLVEETRLNRGA